MLSRAITLLILLNVLAVMMETVEGFQAKFEQQLWAFELFSVGAFAVEYLFRLWSVTEDPRFSSSVAGRIRYALTPFALVDLLAIIPVFLPLVVHADLRYLRALRLLRLFKVGRYSDSFRLLQAVAVNSKDALVVTLSTMFVILIIASSFLYFAEHEAQPDVFSSIPASLWWGVATLTTVGYGDIFPITPVGKVFAAAIAIISIGIFALPTGILSAGFMEELNRRRHQDGSCPTCGKPTEKL